MYIPEFWCGVALTLVIELAVIIGWSLFSSHRKDD